MAAAAYNANGAHYKQHRRSPLPSFLSNQITFRLLCHVSIAGGIIGKSGSIVKLIEQDTGAKIRVDDGLPSCEERVVRIVSSQHTKKTIRLNTTNNNISVLKDDDDEDEDDEEQEDDEEEEEHEVSFAQYGVLRVFERALEVESDIRGVDLVQSGGVPCRLLAESSSIGVLMGKGGKRIEHIRGETGAGIRVLNGGFLPACALPNDELIQITGDILAVKKAIIVVLQALQDNPQLDMPSMTAPFGTFSDPRHEFHPHQNSFVQPTRAPTLNGSMDCSRRGHPSQVDMTSVLDLKKMQQGVEFKLISTDDRIGGLIGKGGMVVKALQKETGALITVGASITESDDRVITVFALENLESRYSPAQNAVVRVFTRSVEAGGLEPGSSVAARLMVPSHQVGCLIGKGGTIATELRKATSTGLWVLNGDQVPKCATENDKVVQITGHFGNVQNALFHVTGRLRDNLCATRMLKSAGSGNPISPNVYQPMGPPHYVDQQAALTDSMGHLRLSSSSDQPRSSRQQASRTGDRRKLRDDTYTERGPARGDLELSSESTAIVTSTTLEILVSERILPSVYGENESNLSRLREISGARIEVREAGLDSNEATVIISGTPDQAQVAQSLLHAFIRSGSNYRS